MMKPEKDKEKWDKAIEKLKEKEEEQKWSELLCKIDPANVDGRHHKCIGPKCGHWNKTVGICGFAAIGGILYQLTPDVSK